MVFSSLTFLVFLIIVFSLYWLFDRRGQNILLLVASYIFYGWWDWRFLGIIFISSLLDYWIGLRIAGTDSPVHRKFYLGLTLAANLGLLGFFKYFNFFAESFGVLLNSLGMQASYTTLNIVLPVGISFYTFKTLSYNIDVYRRDCPAHRNLLEFLTFIAFFPELVAGPIMRATNLLNQFVVPRFFDVEKAKDGVRQMIWGLFQKVVVADGLAAYVNEAYRRNGDAGGATLLLGTIFFAFQIYCDFAGYSNIASGVARLFGFQLVRNFAYPYFSRNIAEFWQRWHISLSTWFRDYFYIPIGGNRGSFARTIFNIVLTFTVSGLWHGANWTFVLWGLANGLLFLPILLKRRFSKEESGSIKSPPGYRDLPAIIVNFGLILATWVLFRSENLGHARQIFSSILNDFDWRFFLQDAARLKFLVAVLLLAEWLQRDKVHPLEIENLPVPVRWGIYNATAFGIVLFGTFQYTPFIYFQF